MKQAAITCVLSASLLFLLSSCSSQSSTISSGSSASLGDSSAQAVSSAMPTGSSAGPATSAPEGISPEEALTIALDNAGVPESSAYHIKTEQDRDHGIPIYDIEFETEYGDFDFEISIENGQIVGADYEIQEEWLASLGGHAVTLEEARTLVQEKVPGSAADAIQIWEERDDGQSRYEGELFFEQIKYEFEIDPSTGIIFDWNADLRD